MIDFTTRDEAFADLIRIAERAARSRANILVVGESGSGKTRLARWIHERSARAGGPFVEVHCASIPVELIESEMFGHEPGAFTGAVARRIGRFEQAHGGTLFLDEIQELPPPLQATVLRAVQHLRFERVGGASSIEVDARIVASTSDGPETLVASGRLREDLFYRLDVVRLRLPPLRERPGDIALLAREFAHKAAAAHGTGPKGFSDDAMRRLQIYGWPGNTRELRHVVESACILAEGGTIGAGDLPAALSLGAGPMIRSAAVAGMTLAELERTYIEEVLALTRGNKSAAARILGIHRKTLHDKLRAREDGGS